MSLIDETLEKAYVAKGIKSSDICSDEVFIRRLYLVLTGKLPRVEDCAAFLADQNPQKRSILIDKLLDTEAYVDYQVLKWGDLFRIKSEFPSNIWPNGVQAYNRWVREQIRANTPYDQMVYQLLVSTGSNFRSPAVNYYRAFQKREPELIAENVALLFLGQRSTHASLPRFFTQLKYKSTKEWKEEIVYVDLDIAPSAQELTMPDGAKVQLEYGKDFRKAFAQWLCSKDNKAFARAMSNRIWYWLMGRGVIDPPDDIRAENPPSDAALLEILETEFIKMDFDIRAMMRFILNSDAFSRSSLYEGDEQQKAAELFAYYPTSRLTSEQLIDTIGDITGIYDVYVSKVPEPYSYFPHDLRVSQIGDGSVSSAQIEMFGKPSRDVSLESDRDNRVTSKQVLYLLNSAVILKKLEQSENVKAMIASASDEKDLIDKIYLMMLCRYPDAAERDGIHMLLPVQSKEDMSYLAKQLIWALINSSEFLFNH